MVERKGTNHEKWSINAKQLLGKGDTKSKYRVIDPQGHVLPSSESSVDVLLQADRK